MFLLNGFSQWTMGKAQKISPRDIRVLLDEELFVQARIRGTYDYSVELSRLDDSITGNCTCPAFDQEGECKHLGALWLNLPPCFQGALDPLRDYFYFDELFHLEEEADAEDHLSSLEYTPPNKSIHSVLKKLELMKEVFTQEDPLHKFLSAPHSELVYQLNSSYFPNAISAEIKCKQLLKNGDFGKVKSLYGQNLELLEQLPSFLRPYLRDQQYQRLLIFPQGHLGEIFQRFIRECEVYDIHERRLQWLDAIFDLSLEIDSVSRSFTVRRSFSDGLERSHHGLIYSLGIGIFENSVYRTRYKWDEAIISELFSLQGKVFQAPEWQQLEDFLIHNLPEIIGGDRFNLVEETIPSRFEIHLRYFSPQKIMAIALKNFPRKKGILLKEDSSLRQKIEASTGVSIGERFFLNHSGLEKLMTDFNQEQIVFKMNRHKVSALSTAKLEVKTNIDWFETSLHLEASGHALELHDILKAIHEKKHFVTLKSNEEVLLPEDLRARLGRLARVSTLKNGKLVTHKIRAILLDDWASEGPIFDPLCEEFRQRLKDFERILPAIPHQKFKAKLRDYQSLGLGWMEFLENLSLGGCLADDMGLGKTIQVLAHLHKRKLKKLSSGPSLIVCPKSLVFNWEDELKKFAGELSVKVFTGGSWSADFLKTDVLLISYALVQRNIEDLKEIDFDYVILDEAQFIKNPQGLTTKSVQLLKAKHRLALTGTPIENHLGDLMSIFNFLIPGSFSSGMFKNRDITGEDLKFLRPFILRRTKEEVLNELPAKTVQVIYCDQTPEEENYYRQLRQLVSHETQGQENKIQILAALTRLRQASCHLGLLDPKRISQESGKLLVLKELTQEILETGHKILIFSQFTELLKLARSYLGMNDSNSVYLDGSTKERKSVVESFKQDQNRRCFFISLKAGGTGLNLTEANYCFILDPWWNPAAENQAIDRTHRLGQTLPVNAYRLISRHTIEEKVLELQKRKTDLAKDFMEGNEDFIRFLGKEDLAFLFST
jgi:SNF2 family DNA or RNA helicase